MMKKVFKYSICIISLMLYSSCSHWEYIPPQHYTRDITISFSGNVDQKQMFYNRLANSFELSADEADSLFKDGMKYTKSYYISADDSLADLRKESHFRFYCSSFHGKPAVRVVFRHMKISGKDEERDTIRMRVKETEYERVLVDTTLMLTSIKKEELHSLDQMQCELIIK